MDLEMKAISMAQNENDKFEAALKSDPKPNPDPNPNHNPNLRQ